MRLADPVQIEGYPAHNCGGAMKPTRSALVLLCCGCGLQVIVARADQELARGAERRASQAALSGAEVIRVAGRLLKPLQPQLFAAELLEGGPLVLAKGTR